MFFRMIDKFDRCLSNPGTAMVDSPGQLRRHWLSVLPQGSEQALQAAVTALGRPEGVQWLRRPETGAAMVRGRMGGSGAPFNMGEMTVTRAAVRLADGTVGMGYTAGRAPAKAEAVAILDALLHQQPERAAAILAPLETAAAAARETAGRKAAATKVEFFTLVRGENPR
jgi:alpha-D-ribose 1-methylphosphonate 5-triphosphate synthase subunit PhnG